MRSHAMLQIRFSRHRAGRITARWPLGRRIPTGLPVHLRKRHGVHRTGQLRRNLFELQRQGTVPRSDQQPEGPRLLSLHHRLGTFGELITLETPDKKTPAASSGGGCFISAFGRSMCFSIRERSCPSHSEPCPGQRRRSCRRGSRPRRRMPRPSGQGCSPSLRRR